MNYQQKKEKALIIVGQLKQQIPEFNEIYDLISKDQYDEKGVDYIIKELESTMDNIEKGRGLSSLNKNMEKLKEISEKEKIDKDNELKDIDNLLNNI